MYERFEQLYKLEENLHCAGSPIIVSFGQLLKDKSTDNIVVQLKLHSVSDKTIIAAKVSICAFDIFLKELQGVFDYQYLDLKTTSGQYFGADKAILMPDINTRRFDINGISIVFSDYTIWEWCNETNLKPIPKPNRIEHQINDAELIKQYKLMTTEQAVYTPEFYKNLWICTCGEINNNSICPNCKCNKKNVFEYFNINFLSSHLEERLILEQQKREHLAKLQREWEEKVKQENIIKKRNRKRIVTVITLAVVVLSIVLPTLILQIKHNKAITEHNNAITEYNNVIAEIEHQINANHFEYAFDQVIVANITDIDRKKYLDVVIPEMKDNFGQPKGENVMFVCDDFSVIKEDQTLFLKKTSKNIPIYTLPTSNAQYEYKNGRKEWKSGSIYSFDDVYMYAGGYILFAYTRSTVIPNNSDLGFDIDIDTTIMAYAIDSSFCRTLLNNSGITHFAKLIDGRVILNVKGAVFNPYTGYLQEKSNLISKKDENDYTYPYEYFYGLDYIYKTE